jgi:hypothetical protein
MASAGWESTIGQGPAYALRNDLAGGMPRKEAGMHSRVLVISGIALVGVIAGLALSNARRSSADASKDISVPMVLVQASEAPPPSAGHELVYHEGLKMVLLVNSGLGGETQPPAKTRTKLWGWDGNRWRLVDSMGPVVRNLGGVAYDSDRDVLVMYGGSYDMARMYGDTWEWSQSRGWKRLKVSGPGRRDHMQMTYDRARKRVVLFGGQYDTEHFPTDTWTWNGKRWHRAAESGPSARVHHTLQYDEATETVVLFGGYAPGTGPRTGDNPARDVGDTWVWDGKRWKKSEVEVMPRTHARMAFDGDLGELVVIGGISAGRDVPVLVGGAKGWKTLESKGMTLPQRYLTGVAFDKERGVLVLYGGGAPRSSTLFDDTWELNENAWRKVH